jgi:hypothetical protein
MKIILILLFIISITFQMSAGLFDDRYPSAKATAMGGAGTLRISLAQQLIPYLKIMAPLLSAFNILGLSMKVII